MKNYFKGVIDSSIFKFLLVGGCSTLMDFLIYIALAIVIPIFLAKAISMIVASIFSYIFNKNFTFKNRDQTSMRHVVSFYVVFTLNLITNVGVNFIIYSTSGCKVMAFVIATICGMTINYLGQRYWVFKKESI